MPTSHQSSGICLQPPASTQASQTGAPADSKAPHSSCYFFLFSNVPSVPSARRCPATEASVALLEMGSGSHLHPLYLVQALVAQQGWHLGGWWELPQTALTPFKGTSRNRSSHPAAHMVWQHLSALSLHSPLPRVGVVMPGVSGMKACLAFDLGSSESTK